MSDDKPPGRLRHRCAREPLPDLLDALEGELSDGTTFEVLLWDYQQRTATGVRSSREVDRDELAGTLADAEISRPLEVHGENVGILLVNGSGASADLADELADLLAVAIRASEPVSDTVAVRRRTRSMSLPAEMQWRVLPPSRFVGRGARISAAVEPAYDTGGDVFDYTLTDQGLFVAVLDARGHGLRAATVAAVATSAMRRSRRNGDDLATIADEMHVSLGALGNDEEFVSTVLVEIDLNDWSGRWLSAGHLPPLIVGDDIAALPIKPTLPLGMVIKGQSTEPTVQEFTLAEGQALVLYSDGMIENAAADSDEAVGELRFHRALLERVGTDGGDTGHVARSVVEDLLSITGPVLRDDATLLIVDRAPPG
jgi:serine phosphatase RsbU (regulator of sigma subunit)